MKFMFRILKLFKNNQKSYLSYSEEVMQPEHNLSYYVKCCFGGIMSCGLTHSAITPIDAVKCRKQTNPKFAKSIFQGLGKLRKGKQLYLGVTPTLLGYSLQGLGKFGLYEVFKDMYSKMVGVNNAVKYKNTVYLVSAASAEFFADIMLCPFEATKIQIQTNMSKKQPRTFWPAFKKLYLKGGGGEFYKGLVPLWTRQIPYTVVKFCAFERIVESFYTHLLTKPKSEYSKGTQLSVTFSSGYLAGILCAIISHPSDTIVSKIYQNPQISEKGLGKAVGIIYKQIGFKGLWAGLGTRIFMIGTLTGFQWWIYDSWKTFCGFQTSGGIATGH